MIRNESPTKFCVYLWMTFIVSFLVVLQRLLLDFSKDTWKIPLSFHKQIFSKAIYKLLVILLINPCKNLRETVEIELFLWSSKLLRLYCRFFTCKADLWEIRSNIFDETCVRFLPSFFPNTWISLKQNCAPR